MLWKKRCFRMLSTLCNRLSSSGWSSCRGREGQYSNRHTVLGAGATPVKIHRKESGRHLGKKTKGFLVRSRWLILQTFSFYTKFKSLLWGLLINRWLHQHTMSPSVVLLLSEIHIFSAVYVAYYFTSKGGYPAFSCIKRKDVAAPFMTVGEAHLYVKDVHTCT